MTAPRETFMAAAAADLQERYPARHVLRGYQDPATLGDDRLRDGVICLVAGGMDNWAQFVGREAQYGTLAFVAVAWCRLPEGADDADTQALEQLEAELEAELLAWCQAVRNGPLLDAIYPARVTYSRGIECPYGWVVMELRGEFI